MKRLILFKGGVETLEFFTEQMAAVWRRWAAPSSGII